MIRKRSVEPGADSASLSAEQFTNHLAAGMAVCAQAVSYAGTKLT